MTRYFTKDDSGLLIELKMPATSTTVFRHTWRFESDGFTYVTYEIKRWDEQNPLAIEEIEGVVMEAAE